VPALIDESLREITRQLDVDGGLVLRRRLDDGSSDDDDGGGVQALGRAPALPTRRTARPCCAPSVTASKP
jgi:hypothetical protein